MGDYSKMEALEATHTKEVHYAYVPQIAKATISDIFTFASGRKHVLHYDELVVLLYAFIKCRNLQCVSESIAAVMRDVELYLKPLLMFNNLQPLIYPKAQIIWKYDSTPYYAFAFNVSEIPRTVLYQTLKYALAETVYWTDVDYMSSISAVHDEMVVHKGLCGSTRIFSSQYSNVTLNSLMLQSHNVLPEVIGAISQVFPCFSLRDLISKQACMAFCIDSSIRITQEAVHGVIVKQSYFAPHFVLSSGATNNASSKKMLHYRNGRMYTKVMFYTTTVEGKSMDLARGTTGPSTRTMMRMLDIDGDNCQRAIGLLTQVINCIDHRFTVEAPKITTSSMECPLVAKHLGASLMLTNDQLDRLMPNERAKLNGHNLYHIGFGPTLTNLSVVNTPCMIGHYVKVNSPLIITAKHELLHKVEFKSEDCNIDLNFSFAPKLMFKYSTMVRAYIVSKLREQPELVNLCSFELFELFSEDRENRALDVINFFETDSNITSRCVTPLIEHLYGHKIIIVDGQGQILYSRHSGRYFPTPFTEKFMFMTPDFAIGTFGDALAIFPSSPENLAELKPKLKYKRYDIFTGLSTTPLPTIPIPKFVKNGYVPVGQCVDVRGRPMAITYSCGGKEFTLYSSNHPFGRSTLPIKRQFTTTPDHVDTIAEVFPKYDGSVPIWGFSFGEHTLFVVVSKHHRVPEYNFRSACILDTFCRIVSMHILDDFSNQRAIFEAIAAAGFREVALDDVRPRAIFPGWAKIGKPTESVICALRAVFGNDIPSLSLYSRNCDSLYAAEPTCTGTRTGGSPLGNVNSTYGHSTSVLSSDALDPTCPLTPLPGLLEMMKFNLLDSHYLRREILSSMRRNLSGNELKSYMSFDDHFSCSIRGEKVTVADLDGSQSLIIRLANGVVYVGPYREVEAHNDMSAKYNGVVYPMLSNPAHIRGIVSEKSCDFIYKTKTDHLFCRYILYKDLNEQRIPKSLDMSHVNEYEDCEEPLGDEEMPMVYDEITEDVEREAESLLWVDDVTKDQLENMHVVNESTVPRFDHLYDYQKADVIASTYYTCSLYAHPVGRGKTVMANAIISFYEDNKQFDNIVIVAPTSAQELYRDNSRSRMLYTISTPPSGKMPGTTFMLIDEAHLVYSGVDYKTSMSTLMEFMKQSNVKKLVIVTGTPLYDDQADLGKLCAIADAVDTDFKDVKDWIRDGIMKHITVSQDLNVYYKRTLPNTCRKPCIIIDEREDHAEVEYMGHKHKKCIIEKTDLNQFEKVRARFGIFYSDTDITSFVSFSGTTESGKIDDQALKPGKIGDRVIGLTKVPVRRYATSGVASINPKLVVDECVEKNEDEDEDEEVGTQANDVAPPLKFVLDSEVWAAKQRHPGAGAFYTEGIRDKIKGAVASYFFKLNERVRDEIKMGLATEADCWRSPGEHLGMGSEVPKSNVYVVISGDQNSPPYRSRGALSALNHPDNYDGKHVRLVIFTNVLTTASNIYNCLRFYKFATTWLYSKEMQAIGRVLRPNSLDAIARSATDRQLEFYTHDGKLCTHIYRISPTFKDTTVLTQVESRLPIYNRRLGEFLKFADFIRSNAFTPRGSNDMTNHHLVETNYVGARVSCRGRFIARLTNPLAHISASRLLMKLRDEISYDDKMSIPARRSIVGAVAFEATNEDARYFELSEQKRVYDQEMVNLIAKCDYAVDKKSVQDCLMVVLNSVIVGVGHLAQDNTIRCVLSFEGMHVELTTKYKHYVRDEGKVIIDAEQMRCIKKRSGNE